MPSFVGLSGSRRPVSATPADTNEATLLTGTAAREAVVQIWVTNLTGSAANATVKWGDGSTDYSLIDTHAVAPRDYIKEDITLQLQSGWTIKITSGTNSALTFTVMIVETGSGVSG